MRRDVFQAIADPTRRDILNVLAHQKLNLNAVAEQFDISRPAISKQIKILTQCGLVTIRQEGRERICEAQLKPLRAVYAWLDRYRQYWDQKFDTLDSYLIQLQTQKKKHARPTKQLRKKRK